MLQRLCLCALLGSFDRLDLGLEAFNPGRGAVDLDLHQLARGPCALRLCSCDRPVCRRRVPGHHDCGVRRAQRSDVGQEPVAMYQ